jgi:hypothetical protein
VFTGAGKSVRWSFALWFLGGEEASDHVVGFGALS